MSNKRQKISLAIVQNEDDEVLIVKRRNPETGSEGAELKWAFPGGIVEDFETPEETAVQETLEETGHYIETVSLINSRDHPEFPVNLSYYECELTTDATTQFIDDHEIVQIAWVKPSRLKKDYFTTDLDKKVAKHLGI